MRKTILMVAALGAAGVFSMAGAAEARERAVSGTFVGKRGAVATGQATTIRERGLRSRDATVTGPNGRTTSVSDDRTWSRQDGTYNHDRTRVFGDGSSRTVDTDVSRTAPGAYSAERTVTTRDGDTRTQSGTVTITPAP